MASVLGVRFVHVQELRFLSLGTETVKTLLQGWIPQSEVVRTLSHHTHAAGRHPDSYWREHDDPVNYKGDIIQVNLILQTSEGML